MYCICSYFVWLWRSIIALPFILGCWTDFFTDTRKTRDISQRLICVSHKRASSNNWQDGSAHSDQLISLLKVSFWSISCGIYPPKSWEMSDVVPRHTHTRCKYSSQTLFPQTTNWQDCWNKWETISLQSHLWRRPCGVFPPESLTPGQTEVGHEICNAWWSPGFGTHNERLVRRIQVLDHVGLVSSVQCARACSAHIQLAVLSWSSECSWCSCWAGITASYQAQCSCIANTCVESCVCHAKKLVYAKVLVFWCPVLVIVSHSCWTGHYRDNSACCSPR